MWHTGRADQRGTLYRVEIDDSQRLYAGDYALAGYEHICLIERKFGGNELCKNLLTADFRRFTRALDKLVESCKHPYLLLDCSPSELHRKTKYNPDPERTLDLLWQTVHNYKLGLIYSGGRQVKSVRRKVGEQVLRLMLAHAKGHSKKKIDDSAAMRVLKGG